MTPPRLWRTLALAGASATGAWVLVVWRRRGAVPKLAGETPDAATTRGFVRYSQWRWWWPWAAKPVPVVRAIAMQDGRGHAWQLDVHGFQLAALGRPVEAADAYDVSRCVDRLFPAAEALVKATTGASFVAVFDHIVRNAGRSTAERDQAADAKTKFLSAPVPEVHNDYSVRSGRPRIRALLAPHVQDPAALDRVVNGRVAIVNVWCPLAPVARDPLAVVDFRTTEPDDLTVALLRYGGSEPRTGETTRVHHSPRHRWVWFPDMCPGEVVLLKTWDSMASSFRSLFAVHSSVELPDAPADAPPRQSVEFRCLVCFEPEAAELFQREPFVAPHVKRIQANTAHTGFEKLESVEFKGEWEQWPRWTKPTTAAP